MSLDFQQIHQKISEIGQGARARKEFLERQRERASTLLTTHAADLDGLRAIVERLVRDHDPNLRCALPRSEDLDAHFPAPSLPGATVLIAMDGSQVVPDRHAALTYGLINAGAVIMQVGSGDAPETFTESELLFEDDLRNPDGSLFNEGNIALRRDARERAKLLELAQRSIRGGSRQVPGPVVALTDGPLELWGAKDPSNAGDYQKFLRQYLSDLDKLNELGATLGGYVDKPAADLLVRLLEIAGASDEDLKNLREYHPLQGVSDRWLFGKLLKPGERSAVFALQSSSRARYSGARAIHFAYLNVSRNNHPSIARLEFPQWVAEDETKLSLLHAALIQQSSLLGAKPYPYILHRAHETAKISYDEKEQVELSLALELRKQGIEVDDMSGKQSAKNQTGLKGRYVR